MLHNTAIDRCVDEISSTLELAQDLERQLEQIQEAARGDGHADNLHTCSSHPQTKS